MIKSELIVDIMKKMPQLPEKVVALSINHIIESMGDALAKGERIEIRDLGSFSLRYRPSRSAHNPKTGAKVVTLPKYTLHFKPGKELRDRVNTGRTQPIVNEDRQEEGE
jgi:integration host factor subunit beta